jgi:hypothetical protein
MFEGPPDIALDPVIERPPMLDRTRDGARAHIGVICLVLRPMAVLDGCARSHDRAYTGGIMLFFIFIGLNRLYFIVLLGLRF